MERSIVEDGWVRFQWETDEQSSWIRVDEDEEEEDGYENDPGLQVINDAEIGDVVEPVRDVESDLRGAIIFENSARRNMVAREGQYGYLDAVNIWWGAREHLLELQSELQGYIEDADDDSAEPS